MRSELLTGEIERFAESLRGHALYSSARRGEITPAVVASYLNGIGHLINATQDHLELARRRALECGHTRLAAYLAKKTCEERGHERWAESDLARLGQLFGNVQGCPPCPTIKCLKTYLQETAGSNPQRYLAYLLFAEYLTVLLGGEWVAVLEQQCGIPADALSVVTRHVELDRHHVREAVAEFDELLATVDAAPVLRTLHTSMHLFERFCDELLAAPGARPAVHAA